MKSYSRILVLIGFVLFTGVCTSAQTDWFFTSITGNGDLFYIDKDFTQKPKGIIQVWDKVIKANEQFILSLKEWNCPNKTFREIQTVLYDRNGRIIEQSAKPTAWRRFLPDSIGNLIYINVCEVDKNGKLTTDKYDDKLEKMKFQFYSFAQITADDVDLMSEADSRSRPLRKLAFGERLALITEEPEGLWMKVYYPRTGEEGWLNFAYMKIISPGKRTTAKKNAGKKPVRKSISKRKKRIVH